MHGIRVVGVAAADVAALTALWPDVARAAGDVAALRERLAADGADTVLATLAGAGLWAAAAWLAVGFAGVALAGLPGGWGRAGAVLARRTLPRVLRRVLLGSVAGTAGLGVLLSSALPAGAAPISPPDGPGGRPAASAAPVPGPGWPGTPTSTAAPGTATPSTATPSTATPSTATPSTATPSTATPSTATPSTATPGTATPRPPRSPLPPGPTWPGSTSPGAPGAPDAPRATPRPATPPTQHGSRAHPPAATVSVRPGDCLWLLAARRLGPDAGAAAVADYTGRLYAANHARLGPDPDLVRPGVVLAMPPATPTKEPS